MKECQNIEFKEIWSEDYLKWICGFANAQGGKLYLKIVVSLSKVIRCSKCESKNFYLLNKVIIIHSLLFMISQKTTQLKNGV